MILKDNSSETFSRSEIIIKLKDDEVGFHYMPIDEGSCSLSFTKNDYCEGLESFLKTGYCMINGRYGSLEIKEQRISKLSTAEPSDSKHFMMILKCQSHSTELWDLDQKTVLKYCGYVMP